jgi:hypothetical protein
LKGTCWFFFRVCMVAWWVGLYGQNLPYKFKKSYGDFRNRNFEKPRRTTGPQSDLRPDSWSWANSGLDTTSRIFENDFFVGDDQGEWSKGTVSTCPAPRRLSYRGFKPKPAGIRIINFRVTTRLQSKSNRCIWYTTLVIWLLTRPGSSNSNKFTYFYIPELVQMPVLIAHYGRPHTKPVCMGIF